MKNVDPSLVGFDISRLTRLTSSMKKYIDDGKIAGLNVLVSRDGKIAYHENFGYSNIEDGSRIRTDTIFPIFSMTKPITVVAVMMLFEEGKFLLTDPISAYLPEFQDMRVVTDNSSDHPDFIDANRSITIKDLLTHTSGLSYGFYPDSYVDQKYREFDVFNENETLEEGVKKIAIQPLVTQPGEAWRYSYSNEVLAYLIEMFSDKPFDEFLASRIFQPLGMVDTGFYLPTEKLKNLASFYIASEENGFVEAGEEDVGEYSKRPTLTYGGTGLVSTISDFHRFSLMLLNRGRLEDECLLSRKSVSLITCNHLAKSHLPLEVGIHGTLIGMGFGFGVGVIVDANQCGFLASNGSYGWGGGDTTLFWINPEESLIAIIMPNTFCDSYPDFYWKFLTLVHQAIVD